MRLTMTLTNRGGEVRVLGTNAAMRFLLENAKREEQKKAGKK